MAIETTEAVKICTDELFAFRVKILLMAIAREALAEANTVDFHNVRARWASRFSFRSDDDVARACMLISMIPAVQLSSTDAILTAALRVNLNILAGAFNAAPEPAEGRVQEVVITETDHDNDPNTAPIKTRTFRNLFGLLR